MKPADVTLLKAFPTCVYSFMKHVQSLTKKLRGLDFISVLSGSSQICQRVF